MRSADSNPKFQYLRRPEIYLALLAFALRMSVMLAARTYQFSALNNHYAFGYETGSIAGAIARGEGFSSPFWRPSGPTAWIPPIYPYLLAGIFKVFGLFSTASAVAILTINCAFAALTTWTIYAIAERMFGRSAALAAGWMWTVVPFFYRYAITWAWDPAMSGFLLSLGVLCVLRIESPEWSKWAGLGILGAVSALLNASLTTLFPLLFLWAAWKLWRAGKHAITPLIVATAVMACCMMPWMIRNRLVFGQWVFIKSTAAYEFSLGNYPGADGAAYSGAHPALNRTLFEEYVRLGEIEFLREKGNAAKTWAKSHPSEFAKLTLQRIADFWTGRELAYEPITDPFKPWMVMTESAVALAGLWLALRRKVPGIVPIALMLLFYPLPYYLTHTNPKYRHAIEPLLVILIGYAMAEIWAFGTRRKVAAARRAAA